MSSVGIEKLMKKKAVSSTSRQCQDRPSFGVMRGR